MSRISEFKKRALQLKYNENQFDLMYDPYLRTIMAKDIVRKPTGIISNDEHEHHHCLWDEEHGENPNRIFHIMKSICSSGVMARCEQLKSRRATVEEIEMLSYNSNLRILTEAISSRDSNLQSMEEFSSCFDTIYVNQGTINAALTAAGSCIELVDQILTGHIMNGMAVVRPPGHHASANGGMNKLCLINNAALAAEFAVQKHGLKRILIVDIDKEHGLGIQSHFYNRKDVLYFSIHRFFLKSYGRIGVEESDCDFAGLEEGLGFNINVPLTEPDTNNFDYLNIIHFLLLPISMEYKPQLVILCAGFNTVEGAFDSDMLLTPPLFMYLTHKLSELAQSRLAVILEGGFCLSTIADCSVLILKALLDDPSLPLPPLGTPHNSVTDAIFSVIAVQKKFWKSISDYQVAPIPPFMKKIEPTKMLQPHSYVTRNYSASLGLNKRQQIDPQNYHFYYALVQQLPKKMVLVYDYRMLSHFDKDNPNALERPERLIAIEEMITTYGIRDRVEIINGVFLNEQEILELHGTYYVNEIKRLCEEPFPHEYMSVYLNECTYECARLAAGSSIAAFKKVADNQAQIAFAIVRPPGHHAEIDAACGFCIFNNVALTTKYALSKYKYERILIVDFDIHHCNGTTNIFEVENRVLVISLHRYDDGNFFPRSGDPQMVGFCEGKHYNVHVAWNHKGVTDAEYFAAFERVVLPIAHQFNPQIIMVSAGYDAAIYDPIGQCCLSPEMFGHLCHMLKGVCSKMVLFLEGGYCITSLSHSVVMSIKALLGDPPLYVSDPKTISEAALESINQTIEIHKNCWYFLPTPPKTSQTSLHTAIQTIHSLSTDELERITTVMNNTFTNFPIKPSIRTIKKQSLSSHHGDSNLKQFQDDKLPKTISMWLETFGVVNTSSTSSDQLSKSETDLSNYTTKCSEDEDYNKIQERDPEKQSQDCLDSMVYSYHTTKSFSTSTTTNSACIQQYNEMDLTDYFKKVSPECLPVNNKMEHLESGSEEFISGTSYYDDTTFNSSPCSSMQDKDETLTVKTIDEEEVLDEEEDPKEVEMESKENYDKFKMMMRRDKQVAFKGITRLSDIAEQSEFSSDNQSNDSKPIMFDDDRMMGDTIDEEPKMLIKMKPPAAQILDTIDISDSGFHIRQCGRFYIP